MADFRSYDIHVNGKLVAEMTACEREVMNGSERIIASAVVAHTTGVTVLDLKISTIKPVAGMSVDIEDLVEKCTKVFVTYQHNGSLKKCEGVFVRARDKNEVKSGAVTGDYDFQGGTPETIL